MHVEADHHVDFADVSIKYGELAAWGDALNGQVLFCAKKAFDNGPFADYKLVSAMIYSPVEAAKCERSVRVKKDE